MPHPGKRRFSLSTKIAIGIIVVVGIVALLYYQPDGLPFDLGKSISIPGITGGTSAAAMEKLTFTITSDDPLIEDALTIQNVTVTVSGTHRAATSIGDAVFDNQNQVAEITFEGFDGRITLDDTLVVDGTATSAVSEGARIKPKSARFSVEAELLPTSYSIGPLDIQDLELTDVSGTIERLGKEGGTIALEGSDVEVSNFKGTLSLRGGKYVLSGSALRVVGESFTLKG